MRECTAAFPLAAANKSHRLKYVKKKSLQVTETFKSEGKLYACTLILNTLTPSTKQTQIPNSDSREVFKKKFITQLLNYSVTKLFTIKDDYMANFIATFDHNNPGMSVP